jgi:predicted nuclease with TOPRIM domain
MLYFIDFKFINQISEIYETEPSVKEMSQELEEQQRIAAELKERLQSLETERLNVIEKIRVAEAKIEVQELRDKLKIKSEAVSQLRDKLKELEERLKIQEPTIVEEQTQVTPQQEEKPRQRTFF